MIAELSATGRKGTSGVVPSLPKVDSPRGKPKLTLADLVAPVSDDLQLLNDNLQKVNTPSSFLVS